MQTLLNNVLIFCRIGFKKMVALFMWPIFRNFPFFVGVFLLLTLPSWVNCYTNWFNPVFFVWTDLNFPKFTFVPVVFSYLLCVFVQLCFNSIKRLLKMFIYVILIFLDIVELYLLYYFGMRISPFASQLLLQTNANEASDFMSAYILTLPGFSIFLFVIIVGVIIVYIDSRYTNYIAEKMYKKQFTLLLLMLFVFYMGIRSRHYSMKFIQLFAVENQGEIGALVEGFPTNPLAETMLAIRSVTLLDDADKVAKNKSKVKVDSCSYISPKIIFILGESFNKHHSNLYGYSLLTNPKLKLRKTNGELYVFTDVVSAFNSTSTTIQYMLSTQSADPGNHWTDEPLFPMFFKKAGYKVFWCDNQLVNDKGSTFDFLCSYYLNKKEVEEASFDVRNSKLYPYDMEMLTEWDKVSGLQTGKDLIIFHLWGQHLWAGSRFPHTPDNLYFTADSIERADLEEKYRGEISDYDNATRYNDSVVDSIFSLFDDQEAIAIYISDHGDEVNDYRLHVGRSYEIPMSSGQVKCQFEVPMFVWCSSKYSKAHPDIVERIKRAVDRPFMTDDISHMLFDLAGIKSPYYRETKSVINDKYQPRHKRYLLLGGGGAYEDFVVK